MFPDDTQERIIDWNIEDLKGKSLDEAREIRDKIESGVKELIEEIKSSD